MPVKSGIIEHGKFRTGDLAAQYHDETDGQEYHTDNDMDPMQTGDHIVETKENIRPRLAGNQSLRIGVDVMLKLRPPFNIFIYQENNTAGY